MMALEVRDADARKVKKRTAERDALFLMMALCHIMDHESD